MIFTPLQYPKNFQIINLVTLSIGTHQISDITLSFGSKHSVAVKLMNYLKPGLRSSSKKTVNLIILNLFILTRHILTRITPFPIKKIEKSSFKFGFKRTQRELLCNFIELTLRHGCSLVNFLHIFRMSFPKNTSGRLLLKTGLSFF